MTYSEALDIARKLANSTTKAAERLRAKCAESGRQPTFVIMRYGDPRGWVGRLPKKLDARTRELPAKPVGTRVSKDWRWTVRHRPVTLQHAETGQIVNCPSIVAFCAEHVPNASTSDRYHVTPVLDGDRPSFKGWYLPETLAQVVKLRDIYGNVTSHTVRELLTTHGLPSTTVFHLLSGRKRSVNNLMLAETPVGTDLRPKQTKITEVTLIKGRRVVKGSSLPDAARKAGLATAGLYSAAYGFKESVSGFKVAEVKTERKRIISNAQS